MSLPDHREARIAELEGRLRVRPGVRLPVAVVCLAGALFLLARQLPDLAYAVSPSEPLTLGREGDYRFEALVSNRYVQLHGTPTGTAFWGKDRLGAFVVVGLEDTPVLVRRAPLPGETWLEGQAPPPPLRTPFAVRGRLLAQDSAQSYRQAFSKASQLSGVRPRDGTLWIVLEGERPGRDVGAVLVAVLLLGFAAFNGWFVVRALTRRGRTALWSKPGA